MKVALKRLHIKDLYKLQAIVKKSIAKDARLEWPFDREVATKFIVEFNTWGIWINGGTLVGAIEIKPDCEVAYLVASQWQCQGIATLSVKMIKEEFADRQLFALVHPDNISSIRVAEKANMAIHYLK